MDSSQNAFSPHSSSSSPPDSPPQRRKIAGFRFGSLGRGLYPQRPRQLTRQRKLRHLNDSELGGLDLRERSYSLPVSPKSTSGLRSPKGSERWSCSPVPLPQPLPLPELPSHIGRRPCPPDSNLGQRGVRSPVTADGNGTGDRTLYGSKFSSVYACGSTWKNTDHLAAISADSPIRRRGFSQDLNDCPNKLRVNISPRSAPTSGFSSPARSPQRFSPGELLPSSYAAIQDFQSPGSYSLPVSPKSTSGLRSPKGSERWSCSPVPLPQPLPLPELPSHIGRRPCPPDSNLGQRGVRSPVTADGNGTSDRTLYGSKFSSVYACGSTWKNTDHLAAISADSPIRRRGFSQDLNDCPYKLRVNISPRSAPTSGFSSPARSPQRFSPGELLPSSYAAIQDFQSPGFDRLPGCSSQVSPLKTPRSPDYSSLHSPTVRSPCISPCLSPKSPNGVAFSLHPKLLPGSPVTWPEKNGHITVHPLPLPPNALMPSELPLPPKALIPSESAISHHTTEKPNVPSMKNQWQKGKLIGRGTFGSVYVATNRETGALCAMKEVDIIPDDPKSIECIKQLEQEIKVLHQLRHPNIVQYYGSEIVDDHFYIYLEYVHPGSINRYVRDHFGAMTENVVRNFTRHILSGLAYLHSTKTIHRDIKGANLLVDSFGVVKLADFGVAKFLTGQAYDLSLKGSPHWMAPELMQAVIQKNANPDLAFALDIWSLGCTIIEMLNGRPPWSEFEGPAAMFKVLHGSPPIPETLSSEGKDFLHCCFRRNPAERPSAAKLLEHSFVRSSQDQNVSGFSWSFSGMQLVDNPHAPGDTMKHRIHSMPLSSGTQTMSGNILCNGETSRSTLKVPPNLSPLLNRNSYIPTTCSLENNNHCAGLKTHGKDLHPL